MLFRSATMITKGKSVYEVETRVSFWDRDKDLNTLLLGLDADQLLFHNGCRSDFPSQKFFQTWRLIDKYAIEPVDWFEVGYRLYDRLVARGISRITIIKHQAKCFAIGAEKKQLAAIKASANFSYYILHYAAGDDVQKPFELYSIVADTGDAEALYMKANYLKYGKSSTYYGKVSYQYSGLVPINHKTAFECYRAAANKGNKIALIETADYLYYGKGGITKNVTQGLKEIGRASCRERV